MNDWTIEAGEENFEADVLKRSHDVPVLVDFWAPWCGPCRVLGPVLEKLADEYSGKFVLAKINVDESPSLAGAFGVQGIPAVKLIKDGEIAGEFTGALPEPAVREMLSRYLPSEYDEQANEAADLEEQGKPARAQVIYQSILDVEPNHAKSLLGLGRVLMNASDRDDALKTLERISPAAEERKIADRLIARLQLQGDQSADEATLRQKLASQPDSLEARFDLAQALAANEKFEEALSELLNIVKSDRDFRDDGARKAMVQIFELLPPDDPLIDKYRSELAKVLFR
ncbi:MAG TPA: tetratricopeptide repeat protein [Candidatus Polarisedimenticolaceae bacterium]|nr:tetratricopeptide repeat protein [Candidatus Polarisedimenticolaceae bacterium]